MEELFFSEREKRLQKEIREFLNKELEPIKEQINRNNEIPIQLIKNIGTKGYFGPLISKEYGGTEL